MGGGNKLFLFHLLSLWDGVWGFFSGNTKEWKKGVKSLSRSVLVFFFLVDGLGWIIYIYIFFFLPLHAHIEDVRGSVDGSCVVKETMNVKND